jgi:hypothetical protein
MLNLGEMALRKLVTLLQIEFVTWQKQQTGKSTQIYDTSDNQTNLIRPISHC